MSGIALQPLVAHLDALLRTREVPDYPHALNGLQVDCRGTVERVAAAVDCSARTIRGAIEARADMLLVHHGLFWGGLEPLTGMLAERVRLLHENDVALYSAHLPLDAHQALGNSRLLALELGLEPSAGFGRHETIDCGVRGEDSVATTDLHARLERFARQHEGTVTASAMEPGRRTLRWAICSGAGASPEMIREAAATGVDTLIVGEGPHWSAVEAPERGLVILYAGHYATETLGVRALAQHVEAQFGLPWSWVAAPTGL